MKQRILILTFLLLISIRGLFAQCGTIAFSGNDTSGCTPLIVKFTAINFPVGSEFAWDFGGVMVLVWCWFGAGLVVVWWWCGGGLVVVWRGGQNLLGIIGEPGHIADDHWTTANEDCTGDSHVPM